jgi:octaprenyl-diphosphate synthase
LSSDKVTVVQGWVADGLDQVRGRLERSLARAALVNGLAPVPPPGGKLLRPRLLLQVASDAGGPATSLRRAALLATIVELIHVATLYHDDVLDSSLERRRLASGCERFGNKISILLGDAILTAALDLVVRCPRRMQRAVVQAITATLRGEVTQHLEHRSLALSEAECTRVAALKTGSLFGLAAELGAMVAGLPVEQSTLAARFGRRLGTAYQLLDDTLDYAGSHDALGKEPGSDYRQGIATLPLVLAWQRSGVPERRMIEAGFGGNGTANFEAVRDIVLWPGHFRAAVGAAVEQIEGARALLPALGLLDGAPCAAFIRDIEQRIHHYGHSRPVSAPLR